MVKTTLEINVPQNFNFQRTVLSHGWYSLPPFALDKENWILSRTFTLENQTPVAANVSDAGGGKLFVNVAAELNDADKQKIAKDARHILRLDEDFSEFYRLTDNEPGFEWIFQCGAGRMLRSPTVFEDLIKTICTTNCSWALTDKMVTKLVEKLGEPTADGAAKSFPTVEKMAAMPAEFYRDEIRAGYRSGYFSEMTRQIADGSVDVESWLTTDLPTAELKKQIKKIKGAGDYAAENLLKLLGRYDGLALDSWLRMKFANKHNGGAPAPDKQIAAHYEKFGAWRGLAIWLDMTRDWL